MSTKAIIFDFDGVILPDSQQVKDSAYLKLFPGKEMQVSAILPEISHRYGGGRGDRRDIIRDLFSSIEGRSPVQEESDALMKRFADFITREIDQMTPPAPTLQMLRTLSGKYLLYLASATPQEEIERRIVDLGLSSYFRKVFGRPTTKDDVVTAVLHEEDMTPGGIVLVGDATGDLETTERMGIRFIAVKNRWNSWPVDTVFPVVSAENMEEIQRHIS